MMTAWLIYFEDASQKPEIFMGNGAEVAARKRFEVLSGNWNCTLFSSVARPSRAPTSEIASLIGQLSDCAATYADEDGIGEPGILLSRAAEALTRLAAENNHNYQVRSEAAHLNSRLSAANERMKKALKFYGDKNNWNNTHLMGMDRGDRARAALSEEKGND